MLLNQQMMMGGMPGLGMGVGLGVPQTQQSGETKLDA